MLPLRWRLGLEGRGLGLPLLAWWLQEEGGDGGRRDPQLLLLSPGPGGVCYPWVRVSASVSVGACVWRACVCISVSLWAPINVCWYVCTSVFVFVQMCVSVGVWA